MLRMNHFETCQFCHQLLHGPRDTLCGFNGNNNKKKSVATAKLSGTFAC